MSGRTHPLVNVPGLLDLATAQLGVVSRTQLASIGVTRHHVRRQLEAQRWQSVGRRVLVLMTGALDPEQLRWVGVLHCGANAALSALSALEVHGLRGWEVDERHVLVPHSARVPALDGLVTHQSRSFTAAEVVLRRGLRCTSAGRAALDAVAGMRGPKSAAGLVVAVVQQRIATVDQVEAELLLRPGLPHVEVVRAVLRDARAGADSVREIEVASLLHEAGFAALERQAVVPTPDGPRRFDIGVTLADGALLLVEVDGIHHHEVRTRSRDLAKDAAAIALGHHVLRIPVEALPSDRPRLLAQLIRIRTEAERRAGRRNAS